jgi:hypothetical protein
MDYVLLTFPRSGSHYLQQLIYQKTGLFIEKTHYLSEVENRQIISIVRNPEDTFRSLAAMNKHYAKDKSIGIGLPLAEYVSFHKYALENSSILIDYDDLINRPNELVKAMASRFNLDVKDNEYKNVLFDQPDHEHLVSSKKSDEYYKIDLSKFNLFESNESYTKALLKCISI